MSRQYTPGPWWAQENSAGAWDVLTYRDSETADNFRIRDTGATICGSIGDHTEERTSGNEEANARLIAAAPDLLEALEAVIDDLVGGIQDVIDNGGSEAWIRGADTRLQAARRAIAKARISE